MPIFSDTFYAQVFLSAPPFILSTTEEWVAQAAEIKVSCADFVQWMETLYMQSDIANEMQTEGLTEPLYQSQIKAACRLHHRLEGWTATERALGELQRDLEALVAHIGDDLSL